MFRSRHIPEASSSAIARARRLSADRVDTRRIETDHGNSLEPEAVIAMGDKSPKAKDKAKKQDTAGKNQQKAAAAAKAAPPAPGGAKKK